MCLFLAAAVAAYGCIIGEFPFNAFISAFMCSIGLAGLTASLRTRVTDGRGKWYIVSYDAKLHGFIIFSCCNLSYAQVICHHWVAI